MFSAHTVQLELILYYSVEYVMFSYLQHLFSGFKFFRFTVDCNSGAITVCVHVVSLFRLKWVVSIYDNDLCMQSCKNLFQRRNVYIKCVYTLIFFNCY